ncbi:MAG: hypothetical protein U0441_23230 [Polyangiaceae bacterium]
MSDANRHAEAILSAVPDEPFGTRLGEWFDASMNILREAERDDFDLAAVPVDLERATAAPTGPFGRYASSEWRRLVAAMLLADWSCYVEPIDWMSFERLAFMAHVFPAGFRVWWARHRTSGSWLPVGYTAWHPISETAFVTLEQSAHTLHDRTLIPLPSVTPGASFICIVNFSVVASLRKTLLSKQLLRSLAEDLAEADAAGLAAFAVSEDGARVLGRFGLKRSGTLHIGLVDEWVFTCRRGEATS